MTASKFAAKVDNAAVRAGHQLYHHTFGFTPSGSWCVVQQGCRMRRGPRAHRLSDSLASFVDEQHTAVCCDACVAQLKMVASGGICVPAQFPGRAAAGAPRTTKSEEPLTIGP